MLVRYQGNWFKIVAKEYEPERQTFTIAWKLIKNPSMTPEEAYIEYFKENND